MSRFIIVQQEKGGVGKTFLAIHLTTYLRGLGHHFRPVDFDYHTGLVSDVFPDAASVSPDPLSIQSGASLLPSLIERVIKGELYLVDSGANTGMSWAVLHQMCPQLREEMQAAGVKTTLIIPVTRTKVSREKFVDYEGEFPGATRIMVVVREFTDEVFELPKHPAELTIGLPFAPKKLFDTYESSKTPIDAIATSTDSSFGINRAFARGYLPKLHAEFNKVRKHLVPNPVP